MKRTICSKYIVFIFVLILSTTLFAQKANFIREDTTRIIKSPKWAMYRSLVVPGWGQLYNGKIIKAIGFAAAETYFIYCYVYYHKKFKEYARKRREADLNDNEMDFLFYTRRKDFYMDQRNAQGWYLALTIILSIMDAYVDAYLINFEKDMKISFNVEKSGVFVNLAMGF